MSDSTRRGFLAKLGTLAVAPVMAAYIPDEATGLALPDRTIETAKEVPPQVMISGVTTSSWITGSIVGVPDAQLVVYVDGQPYKLMAWRA